MISSRLDSLHELFIEVENVAVPPFAIPDRIFTITWPQSHHRHVVLPAMCNAANISKGPFDSNNFLQHWVVDASVEANPITKCQADIDREALEIAVWINIGIFLDILNKFADAIG